MRLSVLGTGNAQALRCYNTCFVLQNREGCLLCDCGGGNEILNRLKKVELSVNDIHHMILTHAHCDHLLGAVWMIRMIATAMNKGSYNGNLYIYCHDSVTKLLTLMCEGMLQGKMVKHIGERILFCPVTDGAEYTLLDTTVKFFDIHSTKMLQYGFTLEGDGKRICCLGDEPYNPLCESSIQGADWVLCEAFCLYGERDQFKPYEKNHSTVKEACELAQKLNIPNLVLWHTEDSHITERKALYTAEGSAYYHGNLFVPDDLEQIEL